MRRLLNEIPQFLREEYQLTATVVFTAFFSLVLILVSIPFSHNAWFELGTGAAFGYTASFFVIGLLVVLGIVSAWPLREVFSNPETYSATIATLDEKKNNVLAMVAASTTASVAITAVPDDVGTPIADKLMDLSSNLMLILAVIYLEKYLLTIFGFTVFTIIVPLALLLSILAIVLYDRSMASGTFARLARKLVVLGAVLVATVPAGVFVTNMIDSTYEVSYSTEAAQEEATEEEVESADNPLDFILSIPETIADAASDISDELLNQVNRLIEGVAVMLVTSCVIPVLVLLFFLWMANLLLGINIEAPRQMLASRARRMKITRGDIAAVKQGIQKRKG